MKKKQKKVKKTIYIDQDDYKLIKKASKKYNIEEGIFMRKLLSLWIFSNKLQIENTK